MDLSVTLSVIVDTTRIHHSETRSFRTRVKRARVVFSAGVPSTRGFDFARDEVEGASSAEESAPLPVDWDQNAFILSMFSAALFVLLLRGAMKAFFVYILSNKSRSVYVGFTSELEVRTFKHMRKWYPDAFTARYNFDMVVYVERYLDPNYAIEREKEIKKWRRQKKLRLILAVNPDWADLSAEWREDESWQAIPDAKPRFVLRRRPPKT